MGYNAMLFRKLKGMISVDLMTIVSPMQWQISNSDFILIWGQNWDNWYSIIWTGIRCLYYLRFKQHLTNFISKYTNTHTHIYIYIDLKVFKNSCTCSKDVGRKHPRERWTCCVDSTSNKTPNAPNIFTCGANGGLKVLVLLIRPYLAPL